MTAHDAASGQSIFELTASDLEDLPQELLKELRLRHKKRAALQAALGGEEFRELVRDAERYRHLREKYVRYEYETSEFNPRSRILHFRFNHLCDQTLDEAVEASIAATKGES